jgi:hypothetical protein
MKKYSIDDIAKHRLVWAKNLQAEVKRLREGIESYLLRYLPEELVREDGVIIHELKELIE